MTRSPPPQEQGEIRQLRSQIDDLSAALNAIRSGDVDALVRDETGAVQEPVPTSAGEVQISLSIGVTLAMPGESTDALIARADAAMFEAKNVGRNRVIPIAG